ncbi:MAG: prepilin peptidase [Pseudomonadota bacterium]
MFETPALIAATAALIPLMLAACYIDVRSLRIPNWIVLGVFATFIVTGLWGLPLETFFWRLGYSAIALVVGFVLFSLSNGTVGGGDMKLTAALVPFVAPQDVAHVLLLWVALAIVGLIVHWMIYRYNRGRSTGWAALDQRIYFPVGLLIGLTMCFYLVAVLIVRLGWV